MALKKKVLIFCILFIVILLAYFIFKPSDSNVIINGLDKENKTIDSSSQVYNISKNQDSKDNKLNKSIDYNDLSLDEIKALREKYPSGIIISDLDKTDISEETKKGLREKFNNLKQYGNFNKNQLGSEFKNIALFRKYVDVNKPLSFQPTKNDFLDSQFNLTGKYYSGSYNEESGYNSYTRLYENPSTKQKIELVETYLNPKNHSTVQRFTESFNKNIDGIDLTWQEIPVGDTTVFSVDFANNQKDFSLSTIRVEKKEVENLVLSLIRESYKFKN